jgi:hypothetical protein
VEPPVERNEPEQETDKIFGRLSQRTEQTHNVVDPTLTLDETGHRKDLANAPYDANKQAPSTEEREQRSCKDDHPCPRNSSDGICLARLTERALQRKVSRSLDMGYRSVDALNVEAGLLSRWQDKLSQLPRFSSG